MTPAPPYKLTPVHALRIAARMLGDQRRREMQRFERGIGTRAQANLLQRVSDIDEVVEALHALEAELSESRA